jgi:release factor glutamine methyltransferase|tara:strand:+ start:867 stop:1751 length:885 start_codon:yes stop_codon:yes gene_type:complete
MSSTSPLKRTKNTWRMIDMISWADMYFREKGFDNPRAEIEWFLQELLNCNRMDIYLRFEEFLSRSQLSTLRSWIKRRLDSEPLQYITGSAEFYGRKFIVNEYVLIPRPETERLIDITLEKIKYMDSPTILDVGTGSGCIGITLALESANADISAVDISKSALDTAMDNAKQMDVNNIQFFHLNILKETALHPVDILVSNPPYVTKMDMDVLMKDVRKYEPRSALTDEGDGLTFYRHFSQMAKSLINSDGWLILEVGLDDHPQMVKEMFSQAGFNNIKLIKDYNGDDRVLTVQIK